MVNTTDESARTLTLHLQNLVVADESSSADLAQAWSWLRKGRSFIATVTALAAIASGIYVLLAPPWYRAQTLLVPADESSLPGGLAGSLGALGGLVGLGNLRMGGGSSAESIAMLTSTEFTADFIEANNLVPVLFADDWDAAKGRWSRKVAGREPDLRDAVKLFDERVRIVREDKKTGLVTLAIEWKDPATAAKWANDLVERLNAKVRGRHLSEADANVKYLKQELAGTDVVVLQQAVGRLLDSEMQKAMVARVQKDAAFRVLDRAQTPKFRSHPKRVQVVALSTVVAGLLAMLAVLLWHATRQQGSARGRVDSLP
ncbi:MAG: Wzz/FepE/Etk N-terminal domain-containing protein [Steroidobacteraceae bacterium]